MEQYDDKHQQHELVYGIGKDDINKRVTLAFRGTDVKFAAQTNWTTNLTALKKTVDIPDEIKGKVEGSDKISFHAGFHDFVFDLTFDDSDDKDKKKYDEILEDVKHVLGKYPDYKLYVTGHSLGGALSTVAAFYLSCDPDIPKPVSCINFAAPRVGDWDFFQATQALEEMGKARFLQVFADGDLVSTLPSIGYYHVGFQLKLYKSVKSKPNFLYPNKNSSWSEGVLRAWSNSVFSNFNFSYDHGDHLARLEKDKAVLEKINLNDSYADFELTGLTPKRYGQDSDSTKERSLNSEPTTGLCCGGSS
uniref:Fungal lipase-type domain-containing protein n=1 Tax=Trieres chinensis TaxID=1514140 RepID=A0A7S2EAG2_TRICV